jgi:hypothetical protein
MAWNAHNGQPSALQPAAACLEHEGEGAAHCASSTRTGECDSQMGNGYQTWTRAAKHKQVRGAMTDGGGRSHKRHGSMKARLARTGPDCPGIWKASEILCFVGQRSASRVVFRRGGCRSSRNMRITSASYVLGRHYLRVRCLYARICRRRIYARGTRRPISSALGRKREIFHEQPFSCLCPGVMSGCPFTSGATYLVQVAWRRAAAHRIVVFLVLIRIWCWASSLGPRPILSRVYIVFARAWCC